MEGFSRDLAKLDWATLPLDAVFATEGAFVYQAMSETPVETGDWKPSRFQRVLQGWRIDRVNIGAFDFYRELVATSDRPFTDLSARLDAEGALRAHTVTGKIRSILAPNLIDGVGRYKATLSSRQLASAAIEIRRLGLRDGAYPPASDVEALRAPSPYTGEMPHYERLEDGSVRLSYPEAADLWRQGTGQHEVRSRRPGAVRMTTHLEWTLPAID